MSNTCCYSLQGTLLSREFTPAYIRTGQPWSLAFGSNIADQLVVAGAGLTPWVGTLCSHTWPHAWKGPCLMLCFGCLEIITNFLSRDFVHFLFCIEYHRLCSQSYFTKNGRQGLRTFSEKGCLWYTGVLWLPERNCVTWRYSAWISRTPEKN